MRKRTSDKDKKEDKNKKENGAEQNPKNSHAEREQESAAPSSPPDGGRASTRRPHRRRSSSEKAAPVAAGPTPPAAGQKASSGGHEAASHAEAPGEGGGKHGNPASEKKKPQNRARKNTGNKNAPSKKGVGTDASVVKSVKNNTDNKNKTAKPVAAAKNSTEKHPGNKKNSDMSNVKNNTGAEKSTDIEKDVSGDGGHVKKDDKNKTGDKNISLKSKRNAGKKDKNITDNKKNADTEDKKQTRNVGDASGEGRAPKRNDKSGSVSGPDTENMADNARSVSQKRPRRRGRSAAGHKTGNEEAPKLDEKDLKVKSDINTGIDIHDEVVGVEPPGGADEAGPDAPNGDELPAVQKAGRGKRRKNPYSSLEYGSVQMMSSLRGFAPMGMLFVLMDVLRGQEEGLIHINQLAQSLSIGKPSLLAQLENLEAAGLIRTLSSSRMGRHVELLSPNLVRNTGSGDGGAESSPFTGLLPVPPSVVGEEAGGQFSASKLEGLARYLQRRGVEIVYIPDESDLDPRVSQIAGFLGKYLSYVLPFYETLKATLNEGEEFTYSLAGLNGRDVTHTLNLCRMLREVDFLASYAYRRAPHYKIVARVNRTPTAINFLTGGWLEHFIRDKVVSILTTHPATLDLPYAFMKNPRIVLPGGEDFELDLLLSVGERIFWIEAKTGEYMDFLPKYSRVSKVLGLNRNTSMLVSVGALAPADNLSARYELSCCNLDEFADVFRINLVRELQQGSIRRRRG